jgi:hypothetical protein
MRVLSEMQRSHELSLQLKGRTMSNSYPQSFPVAKLYRKKSEKSGQTYFVGRWGNARLALLKAKEPAEDGTEIWNLMISEAQQTKRDDAGQRQQEPERRHQVSEVRDWQRPMDDPEIPF